MKIRMLFLAGILCLLVPSIAGAQDFVTPEQLKDVVREMQSRTNQKIRRGTAAIQKALKKQQQRADSALKGLVDTQKKDEAATDARFHKVDDRLDHITDLLYIVMIAVGIFAILGAYFVLRISRGQSTETIDAHPGLENDGKPRDPRSLLTSGIHVADLPPHPQQETVREYARKNKLGVLIVLIRLKAEKVSVPCIIDVDNGCAVFGSKEAYDQRHLPGQGSRKWKNRCDIAAAEVQNFIPTKISVPTETSLVQ